MKDVIESSGIAVRSQLPKALEIITAKLTNIQRVTEGVLKTNGMFTYTPANTAKSINIATSTDLQELIEVYSFLKSKADGYESAAKELGLTTFPVFKWLNYTFDAWKNDLMIRVAVVGSHNEITRLKNQKAELEKFLTKEDQLAALLKEYNLAE